MAYDIAAMRAKAKTAFTSKQKDPDQFRVGKLENGQDSLRYRMFILGPYQQGNQLRTGPAQQGMDFYVIPEHLHWINNKPYACPRHHGGGSCRFCDHAFSLLKEVDQEDKEAKKKIYSTWLPQVNYLANIYMTPWSKNPQELHNRVMWTKFTKPVVDILQACFDRPDAGPADDIQAFGPFFDEMGGFIFELTATIMGQTTSFKTSSFVKDGGLGNGVPYPIVHNGGQYDPNIIQAILNARHDLHSKLMPVDLAAIDGVMEQITGAGSVQTFVVGEAAAIQHIQAAVPQAAVVQQAYVPQAAQQVVVPQAVPVAAVPQAVPQAVVPQAVPQATAPVITAATVPVPQAMPSMPAVVSTPAPVVQQASPAQAQQSQTDAMLQDILSKFNVQ